MVLDSTGGDVREDIRLGNEALANHDLRTARQYFQQVLDAADATEMQKRIAANRLHDITVREQPPAAPPRAARTAAATSTTAATPRTRRKASTPKPDEDPAHQFVRPPDNPIIVINRH